MTEGKKEEPENVAGHQGTGADTSGLTRWIVLLIVITTVAIGILWYLPGSSSGQLAPLFAQQTFSQLAQLIVKQFGVNGVIVGLGGFFTVAAFFTAIPSSGGFAGQGARIAGLFLLQQVLYFPVILVFLIAPFSLLALIPLVIPPAVALELCRRLTKDDLRFSEFAQSKSGEFGTTMTFSARRFIGASALTLVIVAELYYILKFNPSLPFFGWLLVFYLLFFVALQIAYAYGLLFQAINAKDVILVMTNGDRIEGYLTSKGEDHVLMRTKDESILIPTSAILRITLVEKKPRQK